MGLEKNVEVARTRGLAEAVRGGNEINMDIDSEGAFKISDPVPEMLSQICMTHHRF